MVVIVIRAQPKDSGEEIYSTRNYGVENPTIVFASSRMPETYDERDCFNESWPSSHALVLNANLGSEDSECVNGKRTFYNERSEKIIWDAQEHCLPNTSFKAPKNEQKTNEFRLDSPASKDSGYCDKMTPCRAKKINYFRGPGTRENFLRESSSTSAMFLDSYCHNNDNNSIAYVSCSSQVDPEDSIATTKEEEWVTKKKIELTTTRQIETRVKRQVVLEDGKVVEDSGPMVTTNTTEDTEKQEHSQTEHRTLGDENAGENWISVFNPSGCVKEIQEKTVRSREETEERTETENIQHLGDFSDEGYMTAIKSGSDDFRQALEVSNKKELVDSGSKIIHQSLKTKKLIDTEDKTEKSQIQPGGKIVNETRTTRLHEEYGDCNISDDDSSNSASIYETSKKENSQQYRKTKEQHVTEYMANGQKIGEKLHHQAETTEGERHGDFFDFTEMDGLPSKLKKLRLRSQNNRLALENSSEQKNILSKKPLSYEQEEETRKAETSKWLECHFGSESTKSSKGSAEDLDDIVPSTQNSFINVTMKSQPLKKISKIKYQSSSDEARMVPERVIKNISSDNESYITTTGRGGYFQGISQWSSKKEEKIDPNRTSMFQDSGYSKQPYSPLQLNSQAHRSYLNSTPLSKTETDDRSSPAVESARRFRPISQAKSDASISPKSKIVPYDFRENQNQSPSSLNYTLFEKNRPSPPLRKKQKEKRIQMERAFEMKNKKDAQSASGSAYHHEDNLDDMPYRSSTPRDENGPTFPLPANKKLYQRTRFAADIPPPPQPKPTPVKQKNKIGESWKKFVGKLRSSSQDRKSKKKSKSYGSRSPSPRENTYQNYNSLDNYGSLVDRDADEIEEAVSPSRKYNGNMVYLRPSSHGDRLIQRYYLGEDPFSASIYGREKEYEENLNKSIKNQKTESDTEGEINYKSGTLGRFSKSTSRLLNPEIQRYNYSYDRGGVQTLPRKFRDEKIYDKAIASKTLQESSRVPSQWKFNKFGGTKEFLPHTNSMINVSIVNQPYSSPVITDTTKHIGYSLNGPAKPARTYRSNLSRSQSFNIQPGERSFNSRDPYKSNPHLHRLEETSAPLESPSIISHWSQSVKHVNEDQLKVSDTKDKRRLFMKGLYDRAPELFKTLHGDNLDEVQNMKGERIPLNYSSSFRSSSTVNTNSSIDALSPYYNRFKKDNYIKSSRSPVFTETYYDDNIIKTISRSESSGNDDYSETVRIKSKSDDPLNPSETDTVKTFSKKKIPLKNGLATETIESRETKTIQKSQGLRGGFDSDRSSYNRSPSGVVIKVRNSRN